ncbi:uncharacterized protein LOC110747195, partial [Prunus avium]|uniref:Uncharacterized protein LOC110747195 n=1 Tax=Prunus avium TaxID=42229 RepID=A0A6P5RK48_PRUAV
YTLAEASTSIAKFEDDSVDDETAADTFEDEIVDHETVFNTSISISELETEIVEESLASENDWGSQVSRTYEALKYGSFITEIGPLNVNAAFAFAGTTPFITLSYYLAEKLKNFVQKDARFHHWVEKYSSKHYQAHYIRTERVLNHLCRSLTSDARLQFVESRYRSSMELAVAFFSRQVIVDQFPIVPVIKDEFDTRRELLLIACGLSFSCCDSYTKDLMKEIPIVRVGFVHKNVQEVLSQFADFEIKLDVFNEISKKTKKKKLLRIFVGSSVGDLGPLLEAEIGIVINPCDHLLAVGHQFGVTFMPLLWAVIQKSTQMREGIGSLWKSKTGTLYLVNSWHEIIMFIFGACGARNEKPPRGDILVPKSAKTSSASKLWALLPKPKNVGVEMPKPKSAAKLPEAEAEAETETETKADTEAETPKTSSASKLWALLPKPKNVGVEMPKTKSAAKLPEAEAEAETAEAETETETKADTEAETPKTSSASKLWALLPKPKNVGVEMPKPESAAKLPEAEAEAETAEAETETETKADTEAETAEAEKQQDDQLDRENY